VPAVKEKGHPPTRPLLRLGSKCNTHSSLISLQSSTALFSASACTMCVTHPSGLSREVIRPKSATGW
jgi:hypothetical protein